MTVHWTGGLGEEAGQDCDTDRPHCLGTSLRISCKLPPLWGVILNSPPEQVTQELECIERHVAECGMFCVPPLDDGYKSLGHGWWVGEKGGIGSVL